MGILFCAGAVAGSLSEKSHVSSGERQIVRTSQDMPTRTVQLPKLPSQMLQSPKEAWLPLVGQLEKDLQSDLRALDIQDQATLRALYEKLFMLALFRERWTDVPALIKKIQDLQNKAGPKAVANLIPLLVAEQKVGHHSKEWVIDQMRYRLSLNNWTDIASEVSTLVHTLTEFTPNMLLSDAQQLDVQTSGAPMFFTQDILAQLVAYRVQIDFIYPLRNEIYETLQNIVSKNNAKHAKTDIWTPRQLTLIGDQANKPIGIGIWDSGVDLSLFETSTVSGVVFDYATGDLLSYDTKEQLNAALLSPLADAATKWSKVKSWFMGYADLLTEQGDSKYARLYKSHIDSMPTNEVKAFKDDKDWTFLYSHGTHVADIASMGNPYARIFAVSMHMGVGLDAYVPSIARSQNVANSYKKIVRTMQEQGVRVVNMSWRYGPAMIEAFLAWHKPGRDATERAELAQTLYNIERDGLRDAIASAPEILFVAGAGNEDNNADFQSYIPASLQLPNLITVGAVDRAGEPTGFSSSGKSVRLYANGHQVEAMVPGGERVKLSGTSMASPQVTNLAAKLFALKSKLSAAEVLQAMEQTATANGEIHVIHPRAAARHLGLISEK